MDLLGELGFVNIDWRKGTGLGTSPSDQGRDIECQIERTDVDGSKYSETWFVECKQYVKGVPAEKLQNALSWAMAKRPDKLLFIVSNFLSNSAKEFLAEYERNQHPSFKIKVWERPDLEKMAAGMLKLLRKYEIGETFPHLAIMHPAHILYLREILRNTAGYFLETLDDLDEEKRDKALSLAYWVIIQPRFRKPVTRKETMGELLADDVSYQPFKKKFRQLANSIGEHFLTYATVVMILQYLFDFGDTTSTEKMIDRQKSFIKSFQEKLGETKDDEAKKELEEMISISESKIKTLPSDVKEAYALYVYFCENVVLNLLLEPIKLDML